MSTITIMSLEELDVLIIKKESNGRFFLTTNDSIIISTRNLIVLLNYLIVNGYISSKSVEGMLEELHTC